MRDSCQAGGIASTIYTRPEALCSALPRRFLLQRTILLWGGRAEVCFTCRTVVMYHAADGGRLVSHADVRSSAIGGVCRSKTSTSKLLGRSCCKTVLRHLHPAVGRRLCGRIVADVDDLDDGGGDGARRDGTRREGARAHARARAPGGLGGRPRAGGALVGRRPRPGEGEPALGDVRLLPELDLHVQNVDRKGLLRDDPAEQPEGAVDNLPGAGAVVAHEVASALGGDGEPYVQVHLSALAPGGAFHIAGSESVAHGHGQGRHVARAEAARVQPNLDQELLRQGLQSREHLAVALERCLIKGVFHRTTLGRSAAFHLR
mmetsp:Transcript_27167/g.90311  ORF Transcript_27167/g.90311 Transcript_27167/m.90311 type:complete len:318 (-) Transcript_27167:2829-3782(-)